MPNQHNPACLTDPVYIQRIECRTALGNATETAEGLIRKEVALKPVPVYAEEGGDLVPLALTGDMTISNPPRWWKELADFIKPLSGNGWGSLRKPVIFTGSNFGIDGLYGIAKEKGEQYIPWSSAHRCIDTIIQTQNWGNNITIFSHACVSAQLGLYHANRLLNNDLADEILVLSFDFISPFVAAGFNSLKILNGQMPAPFQNREVGSIGLGDGSAFAILGKNGPGPVITSQVLYNEMFHFTANAPDGIGFQKSLDAIGKQLAGLQFWIKGHGTGTLEAGKMEAESVYSRFPDHPLVSWKGSIGHTLGSCALVELAIALAAVKEGTIPGTVGTSGDCFSSSVATEAFSGWDYDSILMLSNAFGGAHGAMIVKYE